MKETEAIRSNRDYLHAYRRGKSIVTKYFVIYAVKGRSRGKMRLGITVSRKIGNAVKRNRAKRVLKESYRLLEPKIARGYDIVLVARARCTMARQPQVMRLLEQKLEELGLCGGKGAETTAQKKESKGTQ